MKVREIVGLFDHLLVGCSLTPDVRSESCVGKDKGKFEYNIFEVISTTSKMKTNLNMDSLKFACGVRRSASGCSGSRSGVLY